MQEEMSSSFAMLLPFILLVLLSSNCSGIRDEEDQKPTQDGCVCFRSNTDAYQIQFRFNYSYGKITPIYLDAEADYKNYVATRHLTSQKLPILCTVTYYETAFTGELNEFNGRTKATVHCALPAKAKAIMGNEYSSSYMSSHIFEITQKIAFIIGNYQRLKRGPICGVSDRVSDLELDIVAFNLNSGHPTESVGGIIQMAATLLFSTPRPVDYYKELTIAVPVRSVPRQFVNTSHDENHKETQLTGFWIDIFKAATAMVPINTTYKLVPFYGSDDQLLKEVARETFDAAVGLTVITKERRQLVEFSCPSLKLGPVIVMKKNPEMNKVFSFLIPFTNEMWFTMAFITVYTAFVVWLIEHGTTAGNESGGLPYGQVGAIFWLPFATLFYGVHRESPRNSLTYFVLGPWLLLILIVTSTYTAGFTSMITSSETYQSSSLDTENLKLTNAIIGCDKDSCIFQYLVEVIGFQTKNIKHISQSSFDDYAKALSNENIKAAVFLQPYAEVFLAKYCKDFRARNLSPNLCGSEFVFPRGSPYAAFMTNAMRHLRESGKFERMKEEMLSFSDCSRPKFDRSIKRGIGPGPFSGLFILSGGASAIAMSITIVRMMRRKCESFVQGLLMGRGLWVWLTTLFSQTRRRNELELSRIISTPQIQLSRS